MKTDCKNINSFFIDFLDKNLDKSKTKIVQDHIDQCNICQAELEQLSIIMQEMSKVEDKKPSSKLRNNFMQLIENEKNHSFHFKRKHFAFNSPFVRIAAGFLILISGVLIGRNLNTGTNNKEELLGLQQEVNEVKQLLVFSKLDQQSASKRIQAVNYAQEISTPNYKIITALINTMNTDENINVRMAAIQALARYTEEKIVVDALVSSLEIQDDPLLQITLINILVELKEQRAIKSMKKIMEDKETHETVKKLAEKGLTII